MALPSGSELGAYRVIGLLGAGGMGEVYRARDERLNRDVALKIIRGALGGDADSIDRFRREAQLLASLNHPNIGAIYGFEEGGGVQALVLELVEGPTLADRIERGPLPVGEAIDIAHQIADALDAAHGQGIVHRDLKPANIKLRPDGTVKVLDFGLAKAVAPDESLAGHALTNAPTSPGATATGVILGTAAYMSPEQARGQSVDKRADIWAFGCILFEMLTARHAFDGTSVSDVVAGVLKSDPPWEALPPAARTFEPVLRRCLEKDSRRRLRDIGDVKLLTDEAGASASSAGRSGSEPVRAFPLRAVAAAATAGALIAGAAVAFLARGRVVPSVASVQRFELMPPAASPLSAGAYGANVAMSPDGSRLVYSTTRDGVSMLVTRRLDRLDVEPIPGSEGGIDPFFSPDGEYIAFSTFKELKKVETAGGPSVVVCPVDAYFSGATWAPDNSIVFTQMALGLFRVPASGGQPEKLSAPDASQQERAYLRPHALADGSVLYTTIMTDGSTRIMARRGRDAITVVRDGFDARSFPLGGSDYLVYGRGDRLMAARFDFSTLKTTGTAVAVQDNVANKLIDGVANVSLSRVGSAALVTGHHADSPTGVVWIDPASGRSTAAIGQPVEYPRNLRLSPDGRRMVLTIGPPGFGQLWVYTLDGSTQPLKLTFRDHNLFPVWSPDGSRIAFMTRRNGVSHLMQIASDGSEVEPKVLMPADEEAVPWSWSPDGAFLLIARMATGKLWFLHQPDHTLTPWLQTPFMENNGSFSPDQHWIAYSTNQTGTNEIWVRPFPGPGTPVRVSSGGGHRPIWKSDNKEIYFENAGKMYAARVVSQSPGFRVDTPRVILERGFMSDDTDENLRYVDLAPDGRFLAVEAVQASGPASILVVQHLDEELARLLPK